MMIFDFLIIIGFIIFRRIREKLFHKLELDDKAKPTYLVKEFRRSAAGQDLAKPEELRTPSTCLKTAKYLIEK